MITGAFAMVKCLEKEGVRVAFGYPGAAICPFYDALIDSNIHHVLVRTEQNAAHAASGYARISGGVGVCITTSGPGATNLLTGIASAYMDSIPLVVITGQVRSDLLGRDVFQEVDITGAAEPFTKHSYLVKKAENLPRIFKEAFHIAATGRPGPVLIDVPIDVQKASISEFDYGKPVDIIGYKPSVQGHSLQIKKAIQAIHSSKQPVLCAGGGVFSANACNQLKEFIEKCNIPVICTMMGIGVLPTEHPLNMGMLGSHGCVAANKAIRDADLVILAGARVGDRAVASPGQVASRAKVIHIDIDPAEIGKNMPAHIPIVGDLKKVLDEFIKSCEWKAPDEWVDRVTDRKQRYSRVEIPPVEGYVEPKSFMRTLSLKMNKDAIICADVGQNQIWSANYCAIDNGRFLTSGGLGTMGYSIPCAVGAKIAAPERRVCAVCGDGSFQMSMMELATIRQENIGVKIIIMCNTRLGMVRELQDMHFGCRHCGVYLEGSPDFVSLAGAYGIVARSVSSNEEAESAIDEMLASDSPYLLVCNVSPDYSSL
ncbi:MAG: biosynthetic-type acetolactate synthase large subunit [Oscillospiraceae bacterium]|nr:biosynthetic-type acetolactate synthase large subunit [Oscillospiraceae bacterium]